VLKKGECCESSQGDHRKAHAVPGGVSMLGKIRRCSRGGGRLVHSTLPLATPGKTRPHLTSRRDGGGKYSFRAGVKEDSGTFLQPGDQRGKFTLFSVLALEKKGTSLQETALASAGDFYA